jgi:hypothetical protein
MSLGRYLLGAGELILIAVALGYGAARLRARVMPGWSGAPARLAELVIGTSVLLLVLELVGLAQVFDPLPIVVAAVAAGALMARLGSALGSGPARPAPPQMGGVATGVALALMLLVAAHWATLAAHAFSVGMWEGDENWYHLPYAARFAQDGSITALHYASPSYLSWFHPLNSELFHAMGMVVFARDIASPWINLLWLAVGLLAAWCIGRPFGVAPLTAAAAALAFDLPVFAGTQAGTAMSDLFGVTFLLAAAAILVNATVAGDAGLRRPIAPAALAVAGLAAGLAVGAKLSFAGPVIALLAVVIALAPRGLRGRTALLTGLPAIATGSFWYLRDFYYVQNPFPYVSKLGPIDLPGPNEGLNGGPEYSVSHYLFDGKVWSDWFLPGLRDQISPVWFLLVGLTVLGIVLAVRQRRNPAVLALAAAALIALIFYIVTPEAAEGPEGMPTSFTAGLRVLEPALVLGLVLAALATVGLDLRLRWASLVGLGALTLVATHRGVSFWDSGGQLAGAILVASALILLPAGAVLLVSRGPRERLAAGLAVAAAIALAVGLGWPRTEHYLDHRYRVDDAPPLYERLSLVPVYRWATGIDDKRIGTSGILQYGLYGDHLTNHVQFLGSVGSDHSFREITDCRTWRQTVNAGDYDYVVAMPRFGGKRTPQIRWTRGPESRPVLRSGPIVVFRLMGPLDPAACAKLPA